MEEDESRVKQETTVTHTERSIPRLQYTLKQDFPYTEELSQSVSDTHEMDYGESSFLCSLIFTEMSGFWVAEWFGL